MTTLTIERAPSLALPSVDRSEVRALLWHVLRIALVGYCLLGLLAYAPSVDAHGRCDCPLCQLP